MTQGNVLAAFGVAAVAAVAIPVAVLHPPLRAEGEGETGYAAARELSESALAGRASYRGQCDRCHGAAGDGTAHGPPLTGAEWADFRSGPVFHGALARHIPGHAAPDLAAPDRAAPDPAAPKSAAKNLADESLAAPDPAPRHAAPSFNQAELMAKYLRELARARPSP